MSNKELYIRLTLGVYKVSELFPAEESLKRDIRKLADEILANLLADQCENGSRNIEEMNMLLDSAENRGLADPRNFLVLRREYAKIKDSCAKDVENSFKNGGGKKRQEVILGILKDSGKVKVSDLVKSFPDINRRTILRDLDIFCQSGIVARSGSGRGACYTIKNATL